VVLFMKFLLWLLLGLFVGVAVNLSFYYLRGFSRPVLDISVSVIVNIFIVIVYHWGYLDGRRKERNATERENQLKDEQNKRGD